MKKKIFTMRIAALALTVIISATTLSSCGSGSKMADDNGFYAESESAQMDYSGGWNGNYIASDYADNDGAVRDVYVEEKMKAPSEEMPEAENQTQSARKIIYSSEYQIQTKDYNASIAALDALMSQFGAYFESSNTYGTAESGNRCSNYRIRVPVQNYKAFTEMTGTLGVVTSSSQNNKDVTEEYFDVEARLESAKIREERVLEILKNAAQLDDVLALERELADIRYEIETFTGTLRKYDSLVNYSTVNIGISEVTDVVVPKATPLTFGERVSKSFRGGINDFVEGFQDFVVFLSYNLIGLVIWFAFIGFAVGILIGISRKKKRANRKGNDNGQDRA